MKIELLREILQNFDVADEAYRGPNGIMVLRESVSGCDVIDLPPCPEIRVESTPMDLLHESLAAPLFRPIAGRTDVCDLVDEQGNYLRTVTAEELSKHIRKGFHG